MGLTCLSERYALLRYGICRRASSHTGSVICGCVSTITSSGGALRLREKDSKKQNKEREYYRKLQEDGILFCEKLFTMRGKPMSFSITSAHGYAALSYVLLPYAFVQDYTDAGYN
jgi:hypothetical protein